VSSLCTSVKLTENQVYDEIKAIVEGTWKSGGERKGIAAGYCDYSVEGVSIDFPQELLDKVDAVREAIKNGQLQLPTDVDQLDAWKATNQFQG
jgi:basic membrane protein A